MTNPIPAITIWQPWASLIAAGLKPYEFRTWPPPAALIGKRIAIHAAARPVNKDEVRILLLELRGAPGPVHSGLRDGAADMLDRVLSVPRSLPLAAVLCTARLGIPTHDVTLPGGIQITNAAKWAWPLDEIEVFYPPIPAIGSPLFWQWWPSLIDWPDVRKVGAGG